MADEAKRGGGGGKEGWRRRERGAGGAGFCRSFQSDFTNEMDIWYATGRAGSNGIHAYAS